MWWRIVLVLLVLGGLTGFGLVYFDSVWSLVQNFWGLDDALRKKILDLLKIVTQFFGILGIFAAFSVFTFRFIKGKQKEPNSPDKARYNAYGSPRTIGRILLRRAIT